MIPAGTIQINSQGEAVQGLHTITMTNATAAGGLVQYTSGQDGPFYVPGEDGQLATIGRDTLILIKTRLAPALPLALSSNVCPALSLAPLGLTIIPSLLQAVTYCVGLCVVNI